MRTTAKLADTLLQLAPDEKVHVIIKSRSLEKSLIDEIMRQPGVTIRHVIWMANAIAAHMPAGQIEDVAGEPWVDRIEEDEKVYAVLDESRDLIGVQVVIDSGFSGKNVKLAFVDSGIDLGHPDFSDRIIAVKDFTLEGFKDNGHGSHVAGIASGSGAHSRGAYRGMAEDTLIIAAKALEADGSGRMSDVMAAIEWSVDMGADIINLSLGTGHPSDGGDALCEICDTAVSEGVVVCAAAGNDGPERRTVGSPGAARRALTVGAATATSLVAEFSSRGPTLDERLKPEIVAPGIDIISTRAKGTKAGKPVDTYYTSATGTSMAVSHVSGLVALLLEANPKASPQLIREALLHTATDLELDDYAQGAGMVDAEAALRYVQTHENPSEPIELSPPRSALLTFFAGVFDSSRKKKRGRKQHMRRLALEPKPFDDELDVPLFDQQS